ncbi:MAG: hypothetical protein PHP82_04485, partial [Candidatus ainarchaeum sp.]|nr:hypothetical protein [Candidatus ainarchaeum sp.]
VEEKLFSLINYLDNNYLIANEKLGFGGYSFKIQLIDSSGFVVHESNKEFANTEFELKYDRIVFVGNELNILRGVIAFEK